jgi:putative spermidine/putrescine transport system substrate-binding protein
LLDSPRSVIGLTLKRLGKSFNSENLSDVADLKPTLQALHQQVKFYSSDAYLEPLLLGDTWAAIGWSTDVLPVVKSDRRIAAVVPTAGTVLSADLWVRPATAVQPENPTRALTTQWIDFWWQPEIATQLSVLGSAVSPLLGNDRAELPKALQDNLLRLPPAAVIDRSEFLLPLSAATVEQFRDLWVAVRQGG